MAIIRAKRTSNYTIINNCVFDDQVLSWEAIGILTYVLSKPDNWKISIEQLIKSKKGTRKESGSKVIYANFTELIKCGFVIRHKLKNGSIDYIFYDFPQNTDQQHSKQPEQQTAASADSQKPDIQNSSVLINTETITNTDKDLLVIQKNDSVETAINTSMPLTDNKRKKRQQKQHEAPIEALIAIFNEVTAGQLNSVQAITNLRKSQLNARWLQMKNSTDPRGRIRYSDEQTGLAWWRCFFGKVLMNDTWNGNNSINFAANFDWIIKQNNFVKILEWRPTSRQIAETRHA